MVKRKPFGKIDANLPIKSRKFGGVKNPCPSKIRFDDFSDGSEYAFPSDLFPKPREDSRKKEIVQEKIRLTFSTRETPKISNCSNRAASSSSSLKKSTVQSTAGNNRSRDPTKRRKCFKTKKNQSLTSIKDATVSQLVSIFEFDNEDNESLQRARICNNQMLPAVTVLLPDDEHNHETTEDDFLFEDKKPPCRPNDGYKALALSKVDENSALHVAGARTINAETASSQIDQCDEKVMSLLNQIEDCFNKFDDIVNKIKDCSPSVKLIFDMHAGTLFSRLFSEKSKENASMKNSTPESLKNAALWTAEQARCRDEAYGTNIEPVFQFPDGKCFRHPILPPGWNVAVSRTKNVPYYIHPDFGKTFYCPVPLPSNDGTIKGTRLFHSLGTPVNSVSSETSFSIVHSCDEFSVSCITNEVEQETLKAGEKMDQISGSAKQLECEKERKFFGGDPVDSRSGENEPTGPILNDCIPNNKRVPSLFSDAYDVPAEDSVNGDINPIETVGVAYELEQHNNRTLCSDSVTNMEGAHFDNDFPCHDDEILDASPLLEKKVEYSDNKSCDQTAMQIGRFGAVANVLDSKASVHSPLLATPLQVRVINGDTSEDDDFCRLDKSPSSDVSRLDELVESPCEATIAKYLKKRDERFSSFQSQGLNDEETGFWAGNGISSKQAKSFLQQNVLNCGDCDSCHATRCYRCSLCRYFPPSNRRIEPCIFRCCENITKNKAFYEEEINRMLERSDRCLGISDRVYCKRSYKESVYDSDNESDNEKWYWGTIAQATERYTFSVSFDDGCVENEIIDEDILTDFEVDLYNQIYLLNKTANFVLHPDD